MEQLMALRRKLNQKQNHENSTPDVQTNDANKNQKPQHPRQAQKQVQSQENHGNQEQDSEARVSQTQYPNQQHKISEQQMQNAPLKSLQSQPILEEGQIDEDEQSHKSENKKQNVDCESQKVHKKDNEVEQYLHGAEVQKSFTDANQNYEKSRQIIPSLEQVNEREKNPSNDKEQLKKNSTFSQNQNEHIKDCPNQKIVSDQNINGKTIERQKQCQSQPPKPQLQLSLHNSCSVEKNSVHLVHQTKEVPGQQSKPAIKVVLKQLDMIKASIHNLNASYRGIEFLRSEMKKDDLLKRRIREKLRDLNGTNQFQVLRKLVKMVETKENTPLYQKKDNSKEPMVQNFQNPKSLGKLHESNPAYNPQQGELQY